MANIIDQIEKENMKEAVPEFGIGDTVKVSVRIKEGEKERIQAFEGVVIARRNGGIRETFTVRKISNGVGVERTFPLHSPLVANVEVTRKGKPRRAKLYYVRKLTGKAAKIKSAENENKALQTCSVFLWQFRCVSFGKMATVLLYLILFKEKSCFQKFTALACLALMALRLKWKLI